jgi:hypothetical protein
MTRSLPSVASAQLSGSAEDMPDVVTTNAAARRRGIALGLYAVAPAPLHPHLAEDYAHAGTRNRRNRTFGQIK